jgi:hypothetical protein
MILPTSVMRIRIVEGGRKKIGLWIPVFLVWPVVIALMVALSPVALIVCIVWPKGRIYVAAGPMILAVCWALRGLEVRVQDEEDQVLISFR